MKRISALTAVLMATGLAGCGGDVATKSDFTAVNPTEPVSDWKLVWSDEFDGSSIDKNKWAHEVNCSGGGNNEKQCYTDSVDNSFVADGKLHIVALPAEDSAVLPYTSARLSTKYKGDFKYGRFEMRAKLPSGQGAWPAFWMLPTDEVYGGWPKSGEIDILEAVNLKAVDAEGVAEANVHGTLHYGRVWPNNASSGKGYLLPDGINPADDFHTYAIEWQEGEIRWYVDGYLYQTQMASKVRYNASGEAIGLNHRGWFAEYFDIATGELATQWNSAPFDQRFHLLLNLAVGGNWPENVNNLGIDANAFADSQTFAIDYVRVYECSQDLASGKGCETVRAGYKDADTLVTGLAPIPSPPSNGIAQNLTIFDDQANPSWPMWDCCAGSNPIEVTDDEEHGVAAEFTVSATPTVLGFYNRTPLGSGTAFDATGIVSEGIVQFDMKVMTAPASPDASWSFKIEAAGGDSAVELALSAGNAGAEPVTGQWATYTFSVQSLFDAGLDISAIDVLMIFPTWGTGDGAVFRLDNVRIYNPNIGLTLFEDKVNPNWPLWDCCAGSEPKVVITDAPYGAVAQFEIAGSPDTVLGFFAADGAAYDASALLADGAISFDLRVVSAPANVASTWVFKIESSAGASAVEVPLASGNNDQAPVTGQWARYRFSLQSLFDAGLDISDINVLMIFPAWGTGQGAVYQLDNVKISNN
ncbi:family 16 glycosylhydrolase [Rheinheimera metallidurans]|uniref:family 16 glycosylhydrolase n=1 Tax=Rheinheimera metallidurans TaxID=2925781 RepID=UPI003001802D